VAEPVDWLVEYRCFVLEREVVTLSPYRRNGQVIEGHADTLGVPALETDAARQFASAVLTSASVACPPVFVLDVGQIVDRGWAVVECNECWASGIYACDPVKVLTTLLRACVCRGHFCMNQAPGCRDDGGKAGTTVASAGGEAGLATSRAAGNLTPRALLRAAGGC
jgi:hypothetical protein